MQSVLCRVSCADLANGMDVFNNLTKNQHEVTSTGEELQEESVYPVFTAEEECAAGQHGVAKDCSLVFLQLMLGYL